MPLRKLVILAAAFAVAGTAAAANWRPLPGAPDVQVDVQSFRQEGTRVAAWLRWWGRPALAPEFASLGVRPARVHRTAVLTEFDCGRRMLRALATQAWDAGGAPIFLSSVPQPAQPVQGEDLAWAYEAVCEAARSAGRL